MRSDKVMGLHDPDATTTYEWFTTATPPMPPENDPSAVEGSTKIRFQTFSKGAPDPELAFLTFQYSRMRAASALLAVLTSVLALSFLITHNPVWTFHACASLCIWATFARLSSNRMSRIVLRVAEYGVFGVMTANLVAGQYLLMLRTATRREPLAFANVVDTTFAGSILLMFAYSMLIPNRWRAAAGPVVVILLAPAVTVLFLYDRHPEIPRFAESNGVMVFNSRVLFLDVSAACLAIYGAHVLGTLRQEVFEARRLNQYRLRERLGFGGMGEVYLAEHRLMGRLCAVKLIRPEAAGDHRSLERFEREVRATARLSHPNIIDIFDYGLADSKTFYYVMEYLRGASLDDLISDHEPLPPGRVVYLLSQACDGLAEAHAAGLVHRDIKPANVFIACVGTRADVVKLLDFGLVKDAWAGNGDSDEAMCGTPQYMAPELVSSGLDVGGGCDIYSLGAVAYFMLTGRPPFERPDALRTMMAHEFETVEPPSTHRPDLPGDLEAVVLRCLEKDPADRFPDANSLKAALNACRSARGWNGSDANRWWQYVARVPLA